MNIRDRIISFTVELLLKVGPRSLTMQDIATGLGLSKKTLYLYFQNKEELIEETARTFIRFEQAEATAITLQSENALDEMLKITTIAVKTYKTCSPNIIYETKKYHPEVWKLFESHIDGFIRQKIQDNLIRGIEEGLYRREINPEIISKMRIVQIGSVFNQEIFPSWQYDFREIDIQLIAMYLYGIVTEEGRAILQKNEELIRHFKHT